MISPYSFDEYCKETMLKHLFDKMHNWFDSLSESKNSKHVNPNCGSV